jgi:hypothetical protein
VTPTPLHEVPRPARSLAPQWESMPATMRRYARWLIWVLTDSDSKVPRAVRRPDSDCDQKLSRNHCSWEVLRTAPDTLNGPGFACGTVDKDITIALVDLDKCRNPQTGVIDKWAWKIIRHLNSYTEVSPSGKGIHIFVIGALPSDAKKQQKVYKLEIYDRKRFSTVTGHRLPEMPDDLQPRETELRSLYSAQQCGDYVQLAKLFELYLETRADTVDIVCPWASEHSGGDDRRDAGFQLTDGKVTGFHCFHASHADKHLEDVRELFGIPMEKGKKLKRKLIVSILDTLGYRFEHDVFADKVYIISPEGRRELDDASENRLYFILEEDYQLSPPTQYLSKLLDDLAREHPVHPVREYLDTLKWDGTPRIDRWLTTYGGADDTELTRTIGAIVLIAAVRRVRSPGSQYQEMLVLESPVQGLNKSSAVQLLCRDPQWFTDSLSLNCSSKETIEQTSGKWIIEAADLSGMRRSDIERLKVFLARSSDRARGAYARKAVDRDRHFILIGTTNDDTYLKDQTGNRRFWPVGIGKFDLAKLAADRDQLWAEAVLREASGVSIRLDPKFYEAAGKEQEKRRVVDPWEHAIEDRLEWPPDGKQRFTRDAVWAAVNVDVERRTPDLYQRLKTVLKRLGFEETTVRNALKDGKPERGWGRNRKNGNELLDL